MLAHLLAENICRPQGCHRRLAEKFVDHKDVRQPVLLKIVCWPRMLINICWKIVDHKESSTACWKNLSTARILDRPCWKKIVGYMNVQPFVVVEHKDVDRLLLEKIVDRKDVRSFWKWFVDNKDVDRPAETLTTRMLQLFAEIVCRLPGCRSRIFCWKNCRPQGCHGHFWNGLWTTENSLKVGRMSAIFNFENILNVDRWHTRMWTSKLQTTQNDVNFEKFKGQSITQDANFENPLKAGGRHNDVKSISLLLNHWSTRMFGQTLIQTRCFLIC